MASRLLIVRLGALGVAALGVEAQAEQPDQHARDAGVVGERRALIQVGVVLLLLTPVIRVIFAGAGFVAGKDRLYAILSLVVLGVLVFSFFW